MRRAEGLKTSSTASAGIDRGLTRHNQDSSP